MQHRPYKLAADTPINIGNIYSTNMCIWSMSVCVCVRRWYQRSNVHTQYVRWLGMVWLEAISIVVRAHKCVYRNNVHDSNGVSCDPMLCCVLRRDSEMTKKKCKRKGRSPSHPSKRKIYLVFTGVLAPIADKFMERIYSMREYIVDQGGHCHWRWRWCHCILRVVRRTAYIYWTQTFIRLFTSKQNNK